MKRISDQQKMKLSDGERRRSQQQIYMRIVKADFCNLISRNLSVIKLLRKFYNINNILIRFQWPREFMPQCLLNFNRFLRHMLDTLLTLKLFCYVYFSLVLRLTFTKATAIDKTDYRSLLIPFG